MSIIASRLSRLCSPFDHLDPAALFSVAFLLAIAALALEKLMHGMQQAPDFIQLPPDSPSADGGRHGTLSRDHYVSFKNL